MERREELLSIIRRDGSDNEKKARRLIEELLFIETQLETLKALPFLKINPKNPAQQKATPAAKQYKELLQQYNNGLKLLFKISGDLDEAEEESPLRKWVKSRREAEP